MRGRRGCWRWPAMLAVVMAVGGCDLADDRLQPGGARPSETSTPDATATPVPTVIADGNPNPAGFAAEVLTHAASAGINPHLLMAILFNESYKPHDPALERAWQSIKPDAAFGVANMHKAAFDEAKQGRDFAERDWQELPDDPDLAIQAAAWFLHDLDAQLPEQTPETYTRDELLALGYNAGAGSMLAFVEGGRPGTTAQSYLDRLRDNWPAAGEAIRVPA
jgi:hypothetical protein